MSEYFSDATITCVVNAAPLLLPGVGGAVDEGASSRAREEQNVITAVRNLMERTQTKKKDVPRITCIGEQGMLQLHTSSRLHDAPLMSRAMSLKQWLKLDFSAIYQALGVPFSGRESEKLNCDKPWTKPAHQPYATSVGLEVVRFLCASALSHYEPAPMWSSHMAVHIVAIGATLTEEQREAVIKDALASDCIFVATTDRDTDGMLPNGLQGERLAAQREIDYLAHAVQTTRAH